VHRDLKPENLMLDKNNILKIVDFGLAKETVRGVGSTMNLKGSKEWMAPEQVYRVLVRVAPCVALYVVLCLTVCVTVEGSKNNFLRKNSSIVSPPPLVPPFPNVGGGL